MDEKEQKNINNTNSWVMDMTEGSIARKLLKFSVPLLIGNLFQQIYNIVDSLVIGRKLGSYALGGVGSVGMVSFLFFALCFGLANGIGVVIANCYGNRDYERVKKMIANAAYILIISGVLMSLCGFFFAGPILHIMKTPIENYDYAYTYMRITCGLTISVALYNGISAILRALGDSKTPLIFLAISAILNIGLDILWVVRWEFGVAGAAYATVLSQFLAALGSILFAIVKNPFFKLERAHFKLDVSIFLENLRVGIPMAIQTAFISISCTLLQTLINGFGPDVMAAYTATGKIENVVFQPFASLGAAMSTFAGQNLGAKKTHRIRKATLYSELIVFAFSALLLTVIFLFDENIIAFFVTEPSVIEIGARGLRIAGSAYFALGSIYIFRGALNGMKDVGFSMLNGVLEVGGRVIFAMLLINLTSLGYLGVWYTNIFTWILIAISGLLRLLWYLKKEEGHNSSDISQG